MKKALKFFMLGLVVLTFAKSSLAQSTSTDIGEGAVFCEKYAKKSLDKKNDFIIWVQGFFSAFNALDPKTKNIAGNKDYHYVRQWLDDYCKSHPQNYFGEAVRALIEELYPQRLPNFPPEKGKSEALTFK